MPAWAGRAPLGGWLSSTCRHTSSAPASWRNDGTSSTTTKYTFDPLDRTSTTTTNAGTASEKTTIFNYLGLTNNVLNEESGGRIEKSYQYAPGGQLLSQTTFKTDGTEEDTFYGYSPHTDVEQLTDDTGNTKATCGYTAYGSNEDAQFTGVDNPTRRTRQSRRTTRTGSMPSDRDRRPLIGCAQEGTTRRRLDRGLDLGLWSWHGEPTA
jgi:hypothetical protein